MDKKAAERIIENGMKLMTKGQKEEFLENFVTGVSLGIIACVVVNIALVHKYGSKIYEMDDEEFKEKAKEILENEGFQNKLEGLWDKFYGDRSG